MFHNLPYHSASIRSAYFSLHMTVEPRLSQTKSYEKLHVRYIFHLSFKTNPITSAQVTCAAVVPFSFIQKTYPELETEIDLTDFTRFRCAITLQTPGGLLTRVRLLEWSVRNAASLALWNQQPKDQSAALVEGVVPVLMSSVGHMSPDIVKQSLQRLGLRR
jgi:hypothetical protein